MLSGLEGMNSVLIVILVGIVTAIITELTTNAVVAAAFIPVLAGVGEAIGVNPFAMMLSCLVACNFAFMLPPGTPPNAIVYGTGEIELKDMMKCAVLHRHGCLWHRLCLTGCPGTSTRSSAHCVRGAPFSARRFPPLPLRQDPRLPADHPAALCSRRAPVISGGAPSGWTAHPLRRLFRQDTASAAGKAGRSHTHTRDRFSGHRHPPRSRAAGRRAVLPRASRRPLLLRGASAGASRSPGVCPKHQAPAPGSAGKEKPRPLPKRKGAG